MAEPTRAVRAGSTVAVHQLSADGLVGSDRQRVEVALTPLDQAELESDSTEGIGLVGTHERLLAACAVVEVCEGHPCGLALKRF